MDKEDEVLTGDGGQQYEQEEAIPLVIFNEEKKSKLLDTRCNSFFVFL